MWIKLKRLLCPKFTICCILAGVLAPINGTVHTRLDLRGPEERTSWISPPRSEITKKISNLESWSKGTFFQVTFRTKPTTDTKNDSQKINQHQKSNNYSSNKKIKLTWKCVFQYEDWNVEGVQSQEIPVFATDNRPLPQTHSYQHVQETL